MENKTDAGLATWFGIALIMALSALSNYWLWNLKSDLSTSLFEESPALTAKAEIFAASLMFTAILFLLGREGKVERAIKTSYLFHFLFISLATCVIIETGGVDIHPAISKALYIYIDCGAPLLLLLPLAYGNTVFRFKTAGLGYALLHIFSGSFPLLLINLPILAAKGASVEKLIAAQLVFAAAAALGALLIFRAITKRPKKLGETGRPTKLLWVAAFSVLAICSILLMENWPLLVKKIIKQPTLDSAAAALLAVQFTLYQIIALIAAFAALTLFSLIIYWRGATGWKYTAYTLSIGFLAAATVSLPIKLLKSSYESSPYPSRAVFIAIAGTALVKAFYPYTKELALFAVASKKRFAVKLFVDAALPQTVSFILILIYSNNFFPAFDLKSIPGPIMAAMFPIVVWAVSRMKKGIESAVVKI